MTKRYGGDCTSTVSSHIAYNKPTIVEEIVADDPKLSAENQSFALRLSGLIGRQDFALSYAYGFRDLPVPTSTSSVGRNESFCDGDECIEGLIANQVVLEYPRQQVIGANLTGEIPILGVPHRLDTALKQHLFFQRRCALQSNSPTFK